MRSQDKMMIDKQAEIISRLNKEIRQISIERDRIYNEYENHKAKDYYRLIMRACEEDENVKEAFRDFMLVAKLYLDNIPGLTCEEEPDQGWLF